MGPPEGAPCYTQFQLSQPEQMMNELLSGELPPVSAPNQVDIVYCSHDYNDTNRRSFKRLLAERKGLSLEERTSILAKDYATNRKQLEEMYQAGCEYLRTLFDEKSVRVHLFEEGGHKILRPASSAAHRCSDDPEKAQA